MKVCGCLIFKRGNCGIEFQITGKCVGIVAHSIYVGIGESGLTLVRKLNTQGPTASRIFLIMAGS